ncbi:MAG TPA: hypothetical protein VFR97_01745 [Capillimicrobium sp.]|nr:hypothetical protein [Capillimicrobium sp.]
MFDLSSRLALAAVLAAGLASAVPATASAAGLVSFDGTTVTYAESSPGERNDPTLSWSASEQRVTISEDGIQAGTGCDGRDGSVSCPVGSGGVVVRTGGGDDDVGVLELSNVFPDRTLRVDLGDGDDRYSPSEGADVVTGGAGNDAISGGPGDDELDGGDGDDDLAGEQGRDTIRGGAGDDALRADRTGEPFADVVDGGPGVDELDDYASDGDADRAPRAAVSLDGRANDGRPGEGDSVTGIERLVAGAAVTFRGDGAANAVTAAETGAASTMDGAGGDDVLQAGDASGDRLRGGAGDDELVGGFGDDVLAGGPGRDRLFGDRPARCNEAHCDLSGSGNDVIDARDGARDSIACGPGRDRVAADRRDVVARDCEVVKRR